MKLPAWLWVAIGVVGFPLGLSGAALSVALIAAIELALKPVVGTLVRARVLGQLSARLKQDVNAEIDNQLASAADDFGVAMTDDVAGFGGVWHQLVGQVNSE